MTAQCCTAQELSEIGEPPERAIDVRDSAPRYTGLRESCLAAGDEAARTRRAPLPRSRGKLRARLPQIVAVALVGCTLTDNVISDSPLVHVFASLPMLAPSSSGWSGSSEPPGLGTRVGRCSSCPPTTSSAERMIQPSTDSHSHRPGVSRGRSCAARVAHERGFRPPRRRARAWSRAPHSRRTSARL